MSQPAFIGIITLLTVVVGPLALALIGRWRARDEAQPASSPDPRLTIASALAFTFAFNLTFFIQELFLVVPKAFTPGLRPILFHNNHLWSGTHPLENVFQGTGAVATVIVGAVCLVSLPRVIGRSWPARLLLFWMAYAGLFMALPQVVVGSVSAASDLGRAMAAFEWSTPVRTLAALGALAIMPWLALRAGRALLAFAPTEANTTAHGRRRWTWRVATLPAFAGILLVVPFRVPRNWIEVLVVPLAVALAGVPWIQAGAWRAPAPRSQPAPDNFGIPFLLALTLGQLAVFQLVLRPGIPFF